MAGRDGRPLARVFPGEKATVGVGRPTAVEEFRVHVSALEIETSADVVPLLQMPGSRAAAGFVAPGIEVNQVFGSRTERDDQRWRLEVPAGESGTYTLVVTGLADGPFFVSVVGTVNGAPVYRHRLSGAIARGQQLVARLEPGFDDVGDPQSRGGGPAHNPRTARVAAARISPLTPLAAPVPVIVVISPFERARLERGAAR